MGDLSENIDKWMKLIIQRFDKLDDKIDRMTKTKDCMDGDDLLDNQDLCLLLGVTKQTLYRYRRKGVIKYYMINNGKVYYKKSEIPDSLLQKRRK